MLLFWLVSQYPEVYNFEEISLKGLNGLMHEPIFPWFPLE